MSISSNNTLLNEILSTIGSLPSSKEEQEKSITIVENGTTEVIPDENKTLSKVTVNVEVEQSGDETPANAKFSVIKYNDNGYPLEINLCSEGDTSSPEFGFSYNSSYASPFWKTIKKANLPSTVTEIGRYGFIGVTALEEVTNWDNLEVIGVSSFDACSNLKYDHLPPKLTTISERAFAYCYMALTELPIGITSIGNSAFMYMSYNANIKKLPSNLVSVGESAFYNNGFATVSFQEIPASVQTIGKTAFRGAAKGIVGSLTFKGTPLSIGNDAFALGTNITDIYVPWAEGAVANAPWGATNATIHYNSEV